MHVYVLLKLQHFLSPSNHLTYYIAQVAAVKIALGDSKGASDALQGYFGDQFLDQIAQSGEQPFESVRTRPYHYRCFNLEAMIVSFFGFCEVSSSTDLIII